jgi:hypothetical protein
MTEVTSNGNGGTPSSPEHSASDWPQHVTKRAELTHPAKSRPQTPYVFTRDLVLEKPPAPRQGRSKKEWSKAFANESVELREARVAVRTSEESAWSSKAESSEQLYRSAKPYLMHTFLSYQWGPQLGTWMRLQRTAPSAWDALRGVLHKPIGILLGHLGLSSEATVATLLNRLVDRGPPSEKEFRRLAVNAPQDLVRWIEDGTLRPSQMTFALEALADCKDASLAVPCLLRVLTHPSSLVREGAVYGLEAYLDYPGIRERLAALSREDPREGVRLAATEALE